MGKAKWEKDDIIMFVSEVFFQRDAPESAPPAPKEKTGLLRAAVRALLQMLCEKKITAGPDWVIETSISSKNGTTIPMKEYDIRQTRLGHALIALWRQHGKMEGPECWEALRKAAEEWGGASEHEIAQALRHWGFPVQHSSDKPMVLVENRDPVFDPLTDTRVRVGEYHVGRKTQTEAENTPQGRLVRTLEAEIFRFRTQEDARDAQGDPHAKIFERGDRLRALVEKMRRLALSPKIQTPRFSILQAWVIMHDVLERHGFAVEHDQCMRVVSLRDKNARQHHSYTPLADDAPDPDEGLPGKRC